MTHRKAMWIFLAVLLAAGAEGCGGGKKAVVVTIAATSGSGQSAAVGTAFGAPLVATVTSSGAPASGVIVTFAAPGSGASATFAGGATTATTNSSGVATSAAISANGTAGAYTVTATAPAASSPASFSLTNNPGPAAQIACVSGSGQSATVSTAFSKPLGVQVQDSNGNDVNDASVVVTFTPPATGASATFAGGANTATTNASGLATSVSVSANGTAGSYAVPASASISGTLKACNFNLTNSAAPTVAISATSGSGQSATINTAFAAPLVATVTTGGTATSGATVTFTAQTVNGATGSFAGGSSTAMVTTGANGEATSPSFSANGTTGTYAVTASVSGAGTPATFTLTNTAVSSFSGTFSFFAAGTDVKDAKPYALAGSVTIDSSGSVTSGVQDFNDGHGLTSPQPDGDSITGGSLSVNSTTGLGKLTLVTNNATLGTETLAIDIVNNSHALIAEFDGDATSTGTIDLQTAQSAKPSGSFSFAVQGIDTNSDPIATGGVFTITNGALSGTIDVGDNGTTTRGTAFTGTVSAPDATTGRGTISNSSLGVHVNYYVVGPEVVRIIVVDSDDYAAGSAFGQGSGGGGLSSDTPLVFEDSGTSISVGFVILGVFTPDIAGGTFTGTADVNFYGNFAFEGNVSGTIASAANGYGTLKFTSGQTAGASLFGLYATDPNINLSDPNNSSGGGGALLVNLDPQDTMNGRTAAINSIGVAVPQTSTVIADLTGNYVFQGQFDTVVNEADFAGQGTLTEGTSGGNSGLTFTGTGVLNDPFDDFGTATALNTGVGFSGFFETSIAGRYQAGSGGTFSFEITIPNTPTVGQTVVIYQASGAQAFWLGENDTTVFGGQLQQQSSFSADAENAAVLRKP
jgi:hypothetical protein